MLMKNFCIVFVRVLFIRFALNLSLSFKKKCLALHLSFPEVSMRQQRMTLNGGGGGGLSHTILRCRNRCIHWLRFRSCFRENGESKIIFGNILVINIYEIRRSSVSKECLISFNGFCRLTQMAFISNSI